MRLRLLFALLLGALAAAPVALADNYLKNADFKTGSQAWRGDGKAAYLKPDGTEGSESDPGAVPVMRLALSKGQPHAVFQEFTPRNAPGKLIIKLEVYAAIDFKRSVRTTDYQTEDSWPVPMNDFMVRVMPDYFQQTYDLKPGQWTKIEATLGSLIPADDRAILFLIPPGEGVVYLKAVSVTP